MLPIIFRKATLADVDQLVRLRIAFLKEVQKPEKRLVDEETLELSLQVYFKASVAKDEFIAWLAIYEGEVIATSGLCFFQIPPGFTLLDGKFAHIINIYTLPQWRGKGVGSQVFEYILQEAVERGYKRISLHATEDGRSVYEKFGFRLTGDEMELRL